MVDEFVHVIVFVWRMSQRLLFDLGDAHESPFNYTGDESNYGSRVGFLSLLPGASPWGKKQINKQHGHVVWFKLTLWNLLIFGLSFAKATSC